jgi:hypothetical protein
VYAAIVALQNAAYTGVTFREHHLTSGWWQGLIPEFRA